jgi:hypothetical protein
MPRLATATRALALLTAAATFCAGVGVARAQVRWDAGLLVGAAERFTSGSSSARPVPGPSAELHAHLAVLPMLRVGPYAAFALSPAPGTQARQVYAAGLRAKVSPPLLAAPWHAWIFAGAGFVDAYTPGPDHRTSVGMLELPLGIGLGYRFRDPWELCAELGAHFIPVRGLLHGSSSTGADGSSPSVGDDFLAVSLSVGVSLGR